MSFNVNAVRTRRRTIGLVTAAAVVAAGVTFANSAGAATSTIVTITKVNPAPIAALTANQVITVTGTGFDEASITDVSFSNTGCTALPYIVTSATTLVVKTKATCVAATNVVVTITDSSSNTAVSTPLTGTAMKLNFITAPDLATPSATVHPIVLDNTSSLTYANQTSFGTSAPALKAGSVIRVTSGAVPFVNVASTNPLSAKVNGVAVTDVTVVGSGAGNYFTAKLGSTPASATPNIAITNNLVTKTFTYNLPAGSPVVYTPGTHDFKIAGSGIAVTPAFGAVKGGTVLSIAGSGFSTTAGNNVMTVGGVACPNSGTPTATLIKCTVPAGTTPGPVTVQVAVTGGLTSVINAGSTFTYVAS